MGRVSSRVHDLQAATAKEIGSERWVQDTGVLEHGVVEAGVPGMAAVLLFWKLACEGHACQDSSTEGRLGTTLPSVVISKMAFSCERLSPGLAASPSVSKTTVPLPVTRVGE